MAAAYVDFAVYGRPVGKQRPRAVVRNGKAHIFTPTPTKHFEKLVRDTATPIFRELCWRRTPDRVIHWSLAWPEYQVTVLAWAPDWNKSDGNNVGASVLDALRGIAYQDDENVGLTSLPVRVDAQQPRTVVRVVGYREVPREQVAFERARLESIRARIRQFDASKHDVEAVEIAFAVRSDFLLLGAS